HPLSTSAPYTALFRSVSAPEPGRFCRAGFTPADGGGNAAWVWAAHPAGRHEAGPTGLLCPRRSLVASVGPALRRPTAVGTLPGRSEEHTSELQSRENL